MPPAPLPSNESKRLAKLRSLGVLDTSQEQRFDRLTELARQITGMPIAAISLLDDNRQYLKSDCGLGVRQTPRSQAFCGYTILRDRPLVIKDAQASPLVWDNPLVTGEPGIRFYAGVPICVDGFNIGSLCVIDLKPNRLSDEQIAGLRNLAEIASSEMTSRLLRIEAEASMRAKSMFLANMSHEIRTPLTAILGYAELLSDPRSGADMAREALGSITRNASHLLQLVSSVLDLSKIEAGQFEIEMIPVRPHDVVQEAVQMLSASAHQAGVRVEFESTGMSSQAVLGDPTRLRQIGLNLLSNAIKFSDGNDVRVTLDCRCEGNGTVAVRLGVTDHGIGMSTDQLDKLFQNFQQADASSTRRFGGSGLGLAIVKRLTNMMGGTITVDSSPGSGSRFMVELLLPLCQDLAETKPDDAYATEPGPRRLPLEGRRILLAEDGLDNQKLLSHFLRSEGAEVTLAGNGQEAIDAVRTAIRGFDCILMDIQMPVMDGCEATHRLRSEGCSTPILALTANTLPENMRRCLEAGCNAYANKPVTRARLTELLTGLLEQRWLSAA